MNPSLVNLEPALNTSHKRGKSRKSATSSLTSPMYDDELPHEVILAIQRVLEVKTGHEDDSLDTLSTNFSAVDVLNDLFPDGGFE